MKPLKRPKSGKRKPVKSVVVAQLPRDVVSWEIEVDWDILKDLRGKWVRSTIEEVDPPKKRAEARTK